MYVDSGNLSSSLDLRSPLCRCLANGCDICNILRSSSGELRRNQVITGNEIRRLAPGRINYCFNTSFPRLVEVYAVNFRKDINHNRFSTHAEELTTFGEVGSGNAFERRAEICES